MSGNFESKSDAQLVEASRSDDPEPFAEIVRRYQVIVCSIALSIVRDVPQSEDVGQEVFLIAWKKLGELNNASRLKPWLAQITRNCAKASLRGKSATETNIEAPDTVFRPTKTPEQSAMSREERLLVAQTLDQLPELFREPLILFYRQDQSVAEVADTLELTPSAVKQRLARGRELLREEIMITIERSLRKSIPAAAFTFAVVNALPALTKTAAAATAASGAAASAAGATKLSATAKSAGVAAKTATATGVGGAVGGSLIGLGGAFIGVATAWLTARYQSERKIYVHYFIATTVAAIIFSVPFIAIRFGWKPWETFGGHGRMVAAQLSWMALFFAFMGGSSIAMQRALKSIGEKAKRENEPELPKSSLSLWMDRWEGRRFTSRTQLLGAPILHIAFSDPSHLYREKASARFTARGWIALGDHARGPLLAIGHTAIAPVAFGTLAMGIVSFGVAGIGLLSFSVLGIALASTGVVSLGIWSCGVLAIGWAAEGVIALGLDSATGMVSLATRKAVGLVTNGERLGTVAAEAMLTQSPLHSLTMWFASWTRTRTVLRFLAIPALVLLMAVFLSIAYRRKPT